MPSIKKKMPSLSTNQRSVILPFIDKPGKQARPIAEADLDRTRMGLSPERVRVVRSFSSYLHQMGPTRTKWKCYGAL